jgi:ketosteroid isomerase-like protein
VITAEDIEQIRRGYDQINAGIVKTDSIHEDFVLEQSPGIPGTRGTFHGPAGMYASMRELREGFDEVRLDPKSFEVHGDWLIVPVAFSASARGVAQRVEITHIWQLRDGRPVRLRVLAPGTNPLQEIAKLGH